MAEEETFFTLRHSSNAFSEPRPGKTLEPVEDSKKWLPILLTVMQETWSLTYTVKQGIGESWLAQTGLDAFDKGMKLYGYNFWILNHYGHSDSNSVKNSNKNL